MEGKTDLRDDIPLVKRGIGNLSILQRLIGAGIGIKYVMTTLSKDISLVRGPIFNVKS